MSSVERFTYTDPSGNIRDETGEVVAWVDSLDTADGEDYYADVPPVGASGRPSKRDEPTAEDPIRPRLRDRLLDRAQLAALPAPTPLISRTLDLNTVAILAGYWGTCKSFIAQDWMACVSTGKRWQGRDVIQHRTLYVAGEGAYGLNARLDAWEYAWRKDIDPAVFHTLPLAVHLGHAGEVTELAELVADGGYGFVVFDTIARCMVGMDENSSQDMGRAVTALYRIREATGTGTVLGVHHTGKDRVTVRGSSALEAGVDCVYTTEGDPTLIRLTRTKRKDGPTEDLLQLSLSAFEHTQSATIMSAGAADMPDSARLVLSAFMSAFETTGAYKAELRTVANLPPATFHRGLNHLLKQHQLINTGSDARPFFKAPAT